jgi:hypothetical protein
MKDGRVVFNLSNPYNRVAGYDQAGCTATGRPYYSHDLLLTLRLMIYGRASHSYGESEL